MVVVAIGAVVGIAAALPQISVGTAVIIFLLLYLIKQNAEKKTDDDTARDERGEGDDTLHGMPFLILIPGMASYRGARIGDKRAIEGRDGMALRSPPAEVSPKFHPRVKLDPQSTSYVIMGKW